MIERFHRTVVKRGREECDLMQMMHLAFADPPPFGAFMLHGHDNAPVRIDLYKSLDPPYNERAIASYRIGPDGFMVPG